MATRGKNIQLFLMDGEAGGRIKCKERDDLKQSGVYFLFGISDETGKGVVYIGQAGARKNGEGILNRLQETAKAQKTSLFTGVRVHLPGKHIVSKIESC